MIISLLIVFLSLLAFTPSSFHKSRTRSLSLITLKLLSYDGYDFAIQNNKNL
jgi:hypothetical protein